MAAARLSPAGRADRLGLNLVRGTLWATAQTLRPLHEPEGHSMSITIRRDGTTGMRHRVQIRHHTIVVDEQQANGGEDAGPSPHELYDAALGSCKALTMLWFAKRKNIPVDDIEVTIERDSSQEAKGIYKLTARVSLTGDLSEEQREALLKVAGKCPLHKLMTEVTTEIETVWR